MERSEWDALRSAQGDAVRAREVTIIMPHYIVPPVCAATCRRLRRLAKKATLQAVERPDRQLVIVGDKHTMFSCNARIIEEGDWDEDYNTPPRIIFRGDPASPAVMRAFDAGAVDYNELPPLPPTIFS